MGGFHGLSFELEEGIHHFVDGGKEFGRRLKAALILNQVDHFFFQGNSGIAVAEVLQLHRGIFRTGKRQFVAGSLDADIGHHFGKIVVKGVTGGADVVGYFKLGNGQGVFIVARSCRGIAGRGNLRCIRDGQGHIAAGDLADAEGGNIVEKIPAGHHRRNRSRQHAAH